VKSVFENGLMPSPDDDQGRADRRRGSCLIETRQKRHSEGLRGAPHGLTATHKEQLNADLLAFLKS
jgi:hypothetical protein